MDYLITTVFIDPGVWLVLDIIFLVLIWRAYRHPWIESPLGPTSTLLGLIVPSFRKLFDGRLEKYLYIGAAILRSAIWIGGPLLPTIGFPCFIVSTFSFLPPLTTVTLIFGARMPQWDDWIMLIAYGLPYWDNFPDHFAPLACLGCALVVKLCSRNDYMWVTVRAISWLAAAAFLVLSVLRILSPYNSCALRSSVVNVIVPDVLMWTLLLLKSARWEPNPTLAKTEPPRSEQYMDLPIDEESSLVAQNNSNPGSDSKALKERSAPQEINKALRVCRKLEFVLLMLYSIALHSVLFTAFLSLTIFCVALLESDQLIRVEITLLSSWLAFLISMILSEGLSRLLKAAVFGSREMTPGSFPQLSLAISGRSAALKLKKPQLLALFLSIIFMAINPVISALFQSSLIAENRRFYVEEQESTASLGTAIAHSVSNVSYSYLAWEGSCSVRNGTASRFETEQCKAPFWKLQDDNLCNGLLKRGSLRGYSTVLSGFGSGRCIFSGPLFSTFQTSVTINNTIYYGNVSATADVALNTVALFRNFTVTLLPACNSTRCPTNVTYCQISGLCVGSDVDRGRKTIELSLNGATYFQLQVYHVGMYLPLLNFVIAVIAFVWPMFAIRDLDTPIVLEPVQSLPGSQNSSHEVQKNQKISEFIS
ncbi:hypothetical protein BJ742DRAFT_199377 [Cladochytrium replicatum]|nr:hypothetical protein BJ742DRAFT_199377 [Cladochytrium replicatum]